MSEGRAARRAVRRWSLRLFRREWRQQTLVLALLTVAVGAAVAVSAIALNADSDAAGQYGDAGGLVRIDAASPGAAEAGIAAARARFGPLDVIAHGSLDVPGSLQQLDVRDQDPHGLYGEPMLAAREGRLPAAAGEVAITDGAASLLDASLGSAIDVGGIERTVVGIVENPFALNDEFALVAPGTIPAPESYSLLVDPDGEGNAVQSDGPEGPPMRLEIVGSDTDAVAVIVFFAATLALALVGLIAAAGFVVVAQRRQRQLGLLAAIGATDRHLRLVMVANGAIVGVIAAAGGLVLGVVGWLIASPWVESAANHRIDRFDLPWMLVAAILAMAVAIATMAAWWPTRAASQVPVMAALSGRPARPRSVHRSLLGALALIVAGAVGILLGSPSGRDARPLLLIGGLSAVIVGSVFFAPAAIRALGALAPRLPFAPRLALRDLARHQARAAAALAAMTLGLGVSVAVVVLAAANTYGKDEGNLSDSEVLIRAGERDELDPSLSSAQVAQLDRRAAAVVAALGGDMTSVPLDAVFDPDTAADATFREPVTVVLQVDPHSFGFVSDAYVATPEVLALYGVDPATIEANTDLLTQSDEPVTLLVIGNDRPDSSATTATQRVDLPAYDSAPTSLITLGAVERNGWVTARAAWIVESPHRLSAAQITAARSAAAGLGLSIEARSSQDELASLRTGGTLVGALLAIAIVAMTVGLIRGESRRDIRTLTATGASAMTRRAMTASTAGALTVLGVIIGTAEAYVALIAAYHADLRELLPIPFSDLVSLGIGLPVVATLVGWLLAGREPRTFSRQALD